MTNLKSAEQTFSQINQLINSSRFSEAFSMLKSRMINFPALKSELEKINGSESTYRYLLDYISAGNQDPSRKEVLEQIRDSLMRANDLLLREYNLVDSSDLYSSTRRMEAMQKSSFVSRLDDFRSVYLIDNPEGGDKISEEQLQKISQLFNYVWTLAGATRAEIDAIGDALADHELPEYLKLSIISALTLGAISYFDADIFEMLLNQYETSDSYQLKARAITAVLLIALLHSPHLKGNLNLRSRLLLSVDDEDLQKIMKEVLLGIVKTYDTQRIDAKMRNEVIPGLMKIKPEIIDRMRNMASDSENFLSDMNPEWEDIIENSEIGDKLREINDLQMEGADVMVTAFSHLKSFPFFSQVSNWFLPFVPGNYEFESLPLQQDSEYINRLTAVMCDSDLHSFLLSLKNLPADQSKLMLSNIENQMKEVKEALTNSIGETEADKLSKKIRQTLQDLYRFFKFFRKKDDFKDPFGKPFLASDIQPLISSLGISSDDIRVLGEFYFQKKYYEEAAGMFMLFNSMSEGDFSVWEKIGFCHDRLGNYDKAVEWYRKAELINPSNKWLHKKLAIALKNSGQSKDALHFYELALENEPENYHLLMSLAQCYLDLDQPQEALKHLYHAQYLNPEKFGLKRAIAWAELMALNFEKAQSLYAKITENGEKADKTDFLNAAHCALACSDMKEAIPLYKKFVELSENQEIRNLVIAIRDDSETLKKLGIKTEDLRLVIDKIRYDRQ